MHKHKEYKEYSSARQSCGRHTENSTQQEGEKHWIILCADSQYVLPLLICGNLIRADVRKQGGSEGGCFFF